MYNSVQQYRQQDWRLIWSWKPTMLHT